MVNIAFIGVGNMGRQVAKNLMNRGYSLRAFDTQEERLNEIEKAGAVRSKTLKDAVSFCDIAILSLPDHFVSEKVMIGPEGILTFAKPQALVIDTTTSLPLYARRNYQKAKESSVSYLDAGSEWGARPFFGWNVDYYGWR